jgi:hypothetical protein
MVHFLDQAIASNKAVVVWENLLCKGTPRS